MGSRISLEDFVDYYVEAALEAIQKNYMSLDVFYEYTFGRISERTGFSREEIKSIYHPFHWNLFLEKNSPLELVTPKNGKSDYEVHVKQENFPLDKSELISSVLKEYKILLQQRLNRISK